MGIDIVTVMGENPSRPFVWLSYSSLREDHLVKDRRSGYGTFVLMLEVEATHSIMEAIQRESEIIFLMKPTPTSVLYRGMHRLNLLDRQSSLIERGKERIYRLSLSYEYNTISEVDYITRVLHERGLMEAPECYLQSIINLNK